MCRHPIRAQLVLLDDNEDKYSYQGSFFYNKVNIIYVMNK